MKHWLVLGAASIALSLATDPAWASTSVLATVPDDPAAIMVKA